MTTAVKICGITRVQDGLSAAHAGAHAIGLVFYPPSPRYVSHGLAVDIATALPPFISTVGLFVDAEPSTVEETLRRVPLSLLQFHGAEPPDYCESFGVPYIKAVRVRPGVDLLQYCNTYRSARGMLLDAYVEGMHGGTGARFDWGLIPAVMPKPVILSGGLGPSSVTEAVEQVKPWAVDVSSGVESAKGIKDAALIAAFIAGARNADV